MKFTIDRKKWLRGDEDSLLLRKKDRKMCCLGIFLNECGMKKKDLMGKGSPYSLDTPLPQQAQWLTNQWGNADLTRELMKVNDDDTICDNTREKKLRELFRKKNITVHFRGR